ncbi:DUF6215 domain-containing protein [Streptomyces fildesensis]|uniref:DUF6215 domain-containing protein n=1 Tax=Streptomyces fildesensis TaxID=375757 RepID=A0ABW8CKG2_9ACTN
MLGFLIRLLPFWVREPLLIAIGSVLGVRIMYLAVTDHDRVAAGLGVVFLVFTAIGVSVVLRALRARRNPSPAAPVAEAAVEGAAQAQVGAGPRPGPNVPQKGPNVWGQAITAVAVVGALAAALWVAPHVLPSDGGTQSHAASCADGEKEELPAAYQATPRPMTGDQLCEALNRPDLARLLGTPGESATSASGTSNVSPNRKVAQPEAEVRFGTYTVNVSAAYNELSTAQYVQLMRFGGEQDIKTLTVLGRPAVLYSDHTMQFELSFGGGKSSGPVKQGPPSRNLAVALERTDRGGYCEVTVWSNSGALPDDRALLGIAEKVLPTIPGWTVR